MLNIEIVQLSMYVFSWKLSKRFGSAKGLSTKEAGRGCWWAFVFPEQIDHGGTSEKKKLEIVKKLDEFPASVFGDRTDSLGEAVWGIREM